jgi:hypothetical protein
MMIVGICTHSSAQSVEGKVLTSDHGTRTRDPLLTREDSEELSQCNIHLATSGHTDSHQRRGKSMETHC